MTRLPKTTETHINNVKKHLKTQSITSKDPLPLPPKKMNQTDLPQFFLSASFCAKWRALPLSPAALFAPWAPWPAAPPSESMLVAKAVPGNLRSAGFRNLYLRGDTWRYYETPSKNPRNDSKGLRVIRFVVYFFLVVVCGC